MPSIRGSRRQVYSGSKSSTTGGLGRKHLMKTKKGRIVSKKASGAAKRNAAKPGSWISFTKTRIKKGGAFKPFPKRGTQAYKAMMDDYEKYKSKSSPKKKKRKRK